jgi:hypothetical protein
MEEEKISGKSTLQEICGEVLWKSPKPRATEKILAIDQERIRGNKSCSPETWHSRSIEIVEILKLSKPGVPELIVVVG